MSFWCWTLAPPVNQGSWDVDPRETEVDSVDLMSLEEISCLESLVTAFSFYNYWCNGSYFYLSDRHAAQIIMEIEGNTTHREDETRP